MKIPTLSMRSPVGFNMTPMIDVVFLLIIFFLVSSHLARRENRIPVDLPVASSGQDDLTDPTPRVTLTILEDGSILLAGQSLNVQELPRRLETKLAEWGNELELRIRGDRRVPYGVVEPILDGAAQVGVWNVTFAVVEREG